MSNDYLPSEDSKLAPWLTNFAAVCAANKAELGLTTDEVTAIGKIPTGFTSQLNEVEAAKQNSRAKTAGKDSFRQASTATVRAFARRFKASTTVSPATLNALGVVSNNASGPVVPVTALSVTGCDDGINKLVWNRSTNGGITIFIVEYREGTTGEWNFAAAVTRTNFNHEDQTPGQTVWYRVSATRAGKTSAPCPPVAAYGGSGNSSLRIAA